MPEAMHDEIKILVKVPIDEFGDPVEFMDAGKAVFHVAGMLACHAEKRCVLRRPDGAEEVE